MKRSEMKVAPDGLLAAMNKLRLALARACGDSCYCVLRKAQGIPGKCWACSGRDVLAETAHAEQSNNSLDRPAASAGTVGGVVVP
jgi:hypothetical protein